MAVAVYEEAQRRRMRLPSRWPALSTAHRSHAQGWQRACLRRTWRESSCGLSVWPWRTNTMDDTLTASWPAHTARPCRASWRNCTAALTSWAEGDGQLTGSLPDSHAASQVESPRGPRLCRWEGEQAHCWVSILMRECKPTRYPSSRPRPSPPWNACAKSIIFNRSSASSPRFRSYARNKDEP
jgi:hypothetical protein